MASFKKVTIRIPTRLYELGLTDSQVHGFSHRWLIISLFQQGKITASEAGELLSTDRDGFLGLLDNLGILYEAAPDAPEQAAKKSPHLNKLSTVEQQLDAVAEELAATKYRLFQVQQHLERADKARSDFIATISHELRTPLNSIIGFARLLLNQRVGPLNQIQQTDLSLIYDSAKHLLSLVDNILDLSKIDAGKIRLDLDWFSVEEIVVGVIASTYILIQDKPIELIEEIEPNLPQIYVDRERIRQVVINLFSNATKFTDAGTITMRIRKVSEKERGFVCFSVEDTGIGISQEDIPKVFEPFQQIDNSTARRAEGTGLGMPISQRLVRLHGGKLWVESSVGQGSTFSFLIPIQPPDSIKANIVHADYRLSE